MFQTSTRVAHALEKRVGAELAKHLIDSDPDAGRYVSPIVGAEIESRLPSKRRRRPRREDKR